MGRRGFEKAKGGNWVRTRAELYAIGAGGVQGVEGKIIPRVRNAGAGHAGDFAQAVSERLHACALRACGESKGWKVKCTTCRPRGQTTARKITSALRISASIPSMLACHHGCQTSLSRRTPPAGASTSTTTSVLA